MDRDMALKLIEVLQAIKADLDTIATNTTPADDNTPDAET